MADRDRTAKDPMKPDSIFRLYSMTKPIVSVAIMQLVEEGRMQITDPVSMYLPEMGKMRVAVEKPGADGKPVMEFVDPARPMTIQDLLRHTSGLIYAGRGDGALNTAWRDAKVGLQAETNAQLVTKLSGLALRFSPGQRWEYGVSTDVLGRVVEVVTGKSLGEALDERIHKPLGMVDTAFVLPAGKVPRAAQPWQKPGFPPMTARFDVGVKAAYESGGGGLVGSTADYLRFASMLANNGSFGGKRILGKQTVAFMTADHTGRLAGRAPGMGFGLGFEVRTATGHAALPGSAGEYGWAGNAGTLFWIDPKEQLIALYMVQVDEPVRDMLRNQFRTMVQSAIVN